jgi:ubiquinone biosynthesis protein
MTFRNVPEDTPYCWPSHYHEMGGPRRAASNQKGARRVHGRERRLWEVTVVVGRHAAGAWCQLIGRRLRGGLHPPAGPARVRAALEELGPTFVKLGQLLSGRSDLVTASYRQELGRLRDHVQPVSSAAVRDQIEQSLGRPVPESYASFEWEPLASASVGQVHAAVLPDGSAVVVKIRRPGICAQIEADLDLLDWVARWMARVGVLRRYDPVGLVAHFAAMLRCELDYTVEAANARHIGRALADRAEVVTPGIVDPLSNASVLTMDRIDGLSLSDGPGLDNAGVDRGKLAATVVRTYMSMVLFQDRFHADPHPGNLFAMPEDRLGIVDFGETGTIGPATRSAISAMLMAIASADAVSLAESMLEVCTATRGVSKAELGADLSRLLVPVSGVLGSIRLGPLLHGLMTTLRRYGLQLPSDLALLLKTIIECESTAAELDPNFDPATMLTEFGAGPPRPIK